jgi:ribosomal protein S18 acetylase RimI-like enzyme
VAEPWEHGTAYRCTRHPDFWVFNTLLLEGSVPELTVDELAAAADRLQADLRHRRIDLVAEDTARRLRPGFDALGWATERLVWLALRDPAPGPEAEEVPVEATRSLRFEWTRGEEWVPPEAELERHGDAEEDVMRTLGARALVARDDAGELGAYVTFTARGGLAEIEAAYVSPALRGRGIGGRLVSAAARAAGAAETLIIADDEGDAKRLYERLGFQPVWIHHTFTRKPPLA